MLKRLKIILAILLTATVWSCDDLQDNYDDCGVWLEFVFDHNMEFTDSFGQQVDSVDVLIFDEQGSFVLSRSATTDELEGRKRMYLGGDLPFGNYTVVTVGGLTDDHFRFTEKSDDDFTRGETTLEDIKLAVRSDGENAVSRELPGLWYGKPVDIRYRADLSIWQMPLVRQTNTFYVTLQHTVTKTHSGSKTRAEEDPLYTAEIVAPEAGAYDHENNPLIHETMIYRPHSVTSKTEMFEEKAVHSTVGRINTMRLLADEPAGYQLIIRNTETGAEVANYDLLELLGDTGMPSRVKPDGTFLPFQEFLDRETNWNILIIHKGPATEGFVAVQILVNNWIVWETGMEVGQF